MKLLKRIILTCGVVALGFALKHIDFESAALARQDNTISVEVAIPWNEIGNRVAAKASDKVQEELKKHGKDGLLWGLTGTLKPSGGVQYLRTLPTSIDSRSGYDMRFEVKARVKLDALGGIVTTKIAAVETVQTIAVRLFPSVQDGKPLVEISADVLDATARKERQARTEHAEKLRDTVRAELSRYLRADVNREVDLLAMLKGRPGVPADIETLRIVNSIEVRENSVVVRIGVPGTGGATLNVPPSVTAPGKVVLFWDSKFRGKSITLSLADFSPGQGHDIQKGWNDEVSSVRWELAPGVRVTLYQHNPPSGKTYTMEGSGEDPTFSDDEFDNDSLSSWQFTR